jgi:signal transduction histidine kinase
MRICVYLISCVFNVYAAWALEESERKGYFLSADLERKLASEKKKLRREAEAKSKAERVLVSYLCHEIRNPFNGVLGFAELIVSALTKMNDRAKASGVDITTKATAYTLKQVTDWCDIIVVNSKHIRDILDNVLDLSKLEAGTLELEHTPIKVMELCAKIHLLLRSTAREGVTFVVEVEPPGLVIGGDHQRWKQLLVNLVSNALKFTHHGRVVLRIKQIHGDSDAVSVEVCDTGVGIRPQEQTMLFRKYQQIQKNTSMPDTKGTGLGLVIAQRIASLLDTCIQVESPWRKLVQDAGGGGTRFFFTVANCAGRGRDGSSTPITANNRALSASTPPSVLRTSLKVSSHAS